MPHYFRRHLWIHTLFTIIVLDCPWYVWKWFTNNRNVRVLTVTVNIRNRKKKSSKRFHGFDKTPDLGWVTCLVRYLYKVGLLWYKKMYICTALVLVRCGVLGDVFLKSLWKRLIVIIAWAWSFPPAFYHVLHMLPGDVHTKNYVPSSFRITSMELGSSYDWPSASEPTPDHMS